MKMLSSADRETRGGVARAFWLPSRELTARLGVAPEMLYNVSHYAGPYCSR